MIKKISLKNVASYKKESVIKFEDEKKRCTFFYGMNGSGKSTLSSYLFHYRDIDNGSASAEIKKRYADCKIECDSADQIIVYNRDFIEKHFGEKKDALIGIESSVTIGADNKNAEEKIEKAEDEKQKQNKALEEKTKEYDEEIVKKEDEIDKKKKEIVSKLKEKSEIAGVQNVIGKKEPKLTNSFEEKYISKIVNVTTNDNTTSSSVSQTYETIASRYNSISSSADTKNEISKINIDLNDIETDEIWKKEIVSPISDSKYANLPDYTDWLMSGFNYIKDEDEPCSCPFCNSNIDENIKKYISSLIGGVYKADKTKIDNNKDTYKQEGNRIISLSMELPNLLVDKEEELSASIENLKNIITSNINRIQDKVDNPQQSVDLQTSKALIDKINQLIGEINDAIKEYNKKIANATEYKKELVEAFWDLIFDDFKTEIAEYDKLTKECETLKSEKEKELSEINEKIDEQIKIIAEHSEKRFDIAYEEINAMLAELGINSFKLEMVDNKKGTYNIVRPTSDSDEPVFKTLSEGEKTMLSFVYFVNYCESFDNRKNIVVVIDDPISSMSTNLMFAVSALIEEKYTRYNSQDRDKNYAQVFILTHNLDFFNAVKHPNERKSINYESFKRVFKDAEGSHIKELGYNEIQNDYQAYWDMIKNEKTDTLVLFNCMRNVIERFFGLVEKKDIAEVFTDKRVGNTKYRAFKRKINNGSHASMLNCSDSVEFDREELLKEFKSLFDDMGYAAHYDMMMEVNTDDETTTKK